MCGIYKIVNKANSKAYIGSTKQEFRFRWHDHKTRLRNNKHPNAHLQAAWNLYGENSFEFIVLERTSPEDRLIKEQSYLDQAARNSEILYNIYAFAGSGRESKRSEKEKQHLKSKAKEQFENPHSRQKHLEAVQKSNQRFHNIILIDPNGKEYGPIVNLYGFCREHGLNVRHIYDMINGKRGRFTEKRWKVKRDEENRIAKNF